MSRSPFELLKWQRYLMRPDRGPSNDPNPLHGLPLDEIERRLDEMELAEAREELGVPAP